MLSLTTYGVNVSHEFIQQPSIAPYMNNVADPSSDLRSPIKEIKIFFIDGIESCPLSIIEKTSHMTHHGIEFITSQCFQYVVSMAL